MARKGSITVFLALMLGLILSLLSSGIESAMAWISDFILCLDNMISLF